LADNKTGELAEWDDDLLAGELEDLNNLDFDMSEFGFDDDDMDDFQTVKDKVNDNDYMQPLADSFIVTPLSFLDTRKGEWQERKKHL